MNKYCKKCGVIIPEARLRIIPTTQTCVNCSSTKPVMGMNVQRGTGEDTWVETILFSQEDTNIDEIKTFRDVFSELGCDEDEEDSK